MRRSVFVVVLFVHILWGAGSLNTSFGNGGASIVAVSGYLQTIPVKTLVDGSGNIYIAGNARTPGSDIFIAKLDSSGALDPSFGVGGVVVKDINSNSFDTARDALIDGGYLYIVGDSNGDFLLIKYDLLGNLISAFDLDGIKTQNIGTSDRGEALAKRGNVLYVGGSTKVANVKKFINIRFDAISGAYLGDTRLTAPTVGSYSADDILIDTSGNQYLLGTIKVGNLNRDLYLLKFLPNSTLDSSFANNGALQVDGNGGSDDYGVKLLLHSNGMLTIIGNDSLPDEKAIVVRIFDTGQLDSGFDGDGIKLIGFGTQSLWVGDALLDSNGDIYMVGDYQTQSQHGIFVYKMDMAGAPKSDFGNSGLSTVSDSSTQATFMRSITLDQDKLIAAGRLSLGEAGPSPTIVMEFSTSDPSEVSVPLSRSGLLFLMLLIGVFALLRTKRLTLL